LLGNEGKCSLYYSSGLSLAGNYAIDECARLPDKDGCLSACARVETWIRDLIPLVAIKGCNWQNFPEGAKRPRRDHFRLAEGLFDVAQHSSREEITSGVS